MSLHRLSRNRREGLSAFKTFSEFDASHMAQKNASVMTHTSIRDISDAFHFTVYPPLSRSGLRAFTRCLETATNGVRRYKVHFHNIRRGVEWVAINPSERIQGSKKSVRSREYPKHIVS